MYKVKYNLLPEVFSNYFALNSSIHNYSTRGASLYRVSSSKTCIRQFAIKCNGPVV